MEIIRPGLTLSIESLDCVPVNELVIRSSDTLTELNYFINAAECLIYPEFTESLLIQIKFKPEFFIIHQGEFPFRNLNSQRQSICCNTQQVLLDMIRTHLKGIYRNLFLESKCLDLVLRAYTLHLDQNASCENCRFLKFDYNKEKIQKARSILLYQLNKPPTIPELSKNLGINQCYLKKGFKEMYGLTIYDFVQEQRMEIAKGMIQQSQFNVSEISESLGFASTSSFSKAFKKMYGMNPSEMRQIN
jgi:AraC-like DNA-binding protein